MKMGRGVNGTLVHVFRIFLSDSLCVWVGGGWGVGGGGALNRALKRLCLHAAATSSTQSHARALFLRATQISILTRLYPCAECAAHFRHLVATHPPTVSGRRELEQWMCDAHNIVNRALGKPTFNCSFVSARWGGVDCEDEQACSLDVGGRRR